MPTLEQVELGEETLAWLLEHPDQHEQSTWWRTENGEISALGVLRHGKDKIDCGSTGCFAGWAAVLRGYDLRLLVDRGSVPYVFDGVTELGPIFKVMSDLMGFPDFDGGRHPFDSTATLAFIQGTVELGRSEYESGNLEPLYGLQLDELWRDEDSGWDNEDE